MAVYSSRWEGSVLKGKGASHCKIKGHSAVICAKTAEPIEFLFGLWAGMGPRNHVLDGGQIPTKKGNFGKRVAHWFSRLRTSDPILYYTLQWAAPSPVKIATSHGGSGPNLIHDFLDQPDSSTQMASRSVQPFLQGSLV